MTSATKRPAGRICSIWAGCGARSWARAYGANPVVLQLRADLPAAESLGSRRTATDAGGMTQTPSLAGLTAADRLLHQRIIVLGQQVDDDIANKLCAELLLLSAEDPKRDIALYINSPGGSRQRRARDLRHHAADPQRREHAGDGAGREHGPVPALGRYAGQALRAAALADPDAPGLGRHRRHRGRHRDPGREPRAHQERDDRPDRRAHRPAARGGRARLAARPVVHRRGGAATTASSTRC